jgi:flagellar biogenesis protein FliO
MTPLARYVLETLLTLLVVAGLAVAVLALARRSGIGRPTGPVRLAGRLALDARRAIYLVHVGETVYVIGASEAGLSKLGELPLSELGDVDLGQQEPPAPLFAEILERIGPRKRPAPPKDAQRSEGSGGDPT